MGEADLQLLRCGGLPRVPSPAVSLPPFTDPTHPTVSHFLLSPTSHPLPQPPNTLPSQRSLGLLTLQGPGVSQNGS